MDQVIALIDSALGHSAIVAVVLEFVLRFIPSQKPLGILHLGASILQKVAIIVAKVAELLDKVLPQNLK